MVRTGVREGTFVDFFAGSGVVSRLAKTLGFRVVANDWEPYTREINGAYVACNRPPAFDRLDPSGVDAVFATLNRLDPIAGYVSGHLCPRDDDAVDPAVDRLFFTRQNGGRIDAMRTQVQSWEDQGRINQSERAYLLGALLYAASYVSNTSGVFKGFHRGWGGTTGTALYRILSRIQLAPPVTHDNHRENLVLSADARDLAEHGRDLLGTYDIAYLDPPYNQHPYAANYHVLNTIALGDSPPVSPSITGRGDKSAIRRDWRVDRRSAYNYRNEAGLALEGLIFGVSAGHILLSYSTDGLIPLETVLDLACRRGQVQALTRRYKRYRVSSQRYSQRPYNVEFILVIDAAARPDPNRTRELGEQIQGTIESDLATEE